MSINRQLLLVIFICFGIFNSAAQITVNFTADQTEGCGSVQVNFCDNSSSTAGSIVSWTWNLGGVNSSNECQGRIFGSAGSYEICLTVTDSDGNTASLCEPNFITVHPLPSPDFESPSPEGCIPHTASFNYTGSSTNITEFIWGVDGSAGVIINNGGSSPDAESTYSIADQYNISLTVTDENGCMNFISKDNYITTYEPTVVEVHAVETFKCEPPFIVEFVNDNIQPNMTYNWNFGNGVNFSGTIPPPVLYNNEGPYTITVIGQNADTNCQDTLVLENYINIGYVVDFTFTPDQGCEDLSVTFSDGSADAADNVSWDFGDGTLPSTDANPTHVYQNDGFYTVTLTREIAGCTSSHTTTTEIEVFALPDVAYNNDNTLGCSIPHAVNFTGTSADAISWSWDFGDGSTSNQQNPNHVYTDFGTYNVSLTVTNANGCESVISTTNIELVDTEASMVNNQFSGCTPLNINLADNSTTVLPITNWLWEINTPSGLLSSTDQAPNFMIPDTGCFDIVLTVTNTLGCSDTQTFSDAVCVGDDPLVNFEAIPTVACVDELVYFTDLSSPFVDTWFWDFGNTQTDVAQNPSTSYPDTGFFDVTLIASDKGCVGQITLIDYIEVTAPKAIFSIVQNCTNSLYIESTNSSIGADNYFWDFGVAGEDGDTSNLFEPIFTYPDTGTYVVTLTTQNFTTNCTHSTTQTLYIHDPLSSFTVSDTEGCVPMTISAINSSVHAQEYEWSGAGITFSNATIANTNITMPTAGTYTDLQLIVTDINGCKDTTQFNETIYANEVTVDFDPKVIGGCQPFEVTFNENSSNLFANNLQWDWVFENNVATATGQTATHTFQDLGQHQVALTVTDNWGCVGSLVLPTAVEVTRPIADFDADTLSCTNFPINFSNNTAALNPTYSWDFGDGIFSTDANPMHIYMTEGIYNPCLTVTDVYGCVDTYCLEYDIVIADPAANFALDTSYASCPPLVVNFENTSVNATTFQWDFGDGSGLSDLENPAHVYTIPGIYNVTLIANSNENCADTFVVENLIVLDGPLGSFHYEVDTSCAPMKVTFFAESQGQFMYLWDFGDGSPLDTVLSASTDTTVYYYPGGTYIPKLAIIDQIGCERILESPTSIFVPVLDLGFQGTDTVLCDFNNPITFLNLINSTGSIDSLEWQFQGGLPATSNDFEPTVTFDQPGLYDVTLIAHNAYCSDTLLQDEYIRIGDVPDANFSMSDIMGCEPLEVTFTDLTTVINGNVEQTHWIFGDGFESFLSQPTHTYVDGTSFQAQLIVTTDVGCVDSISQNITVLLQPDISITGDQEICIGEITQLLATITSDPTGVTYFWENDPTLSCLNCLDPIANPIDTTIYTFVAVSSEGCETRVDFQVDVRPVYAPVVEISNDTLICANDVVQLFVDGGDDIFSYLWDDSQLGLTCYDNCINPIASPEVSTTYTVTVTNSFNCSSIGSVTVDVLDQNQIFAGEDRTICQGDTAQLHLNIGNNPIWLVSDGLDCSACFDAVASPNVTTDFVAQVTTAEGCDIIDTVRVNVLSQQDIFVGENATVCRGESILLEAEFLYPFGNINPFFAWTPASSLDDPTLLNPEAMPSESTIYTLVITADKCTLSDSLRVSVVDKTEIEAVGATICLGDTAQLDIIGSADQFEWIPAEGLSDPTIANPTAIPTNDITYTVIASLSSCAPDTSEALIEVNNLPDVYIPALYSFFEGESVLLNVENSLSDYSYEWFPQNGLSCTDCPNPTANVDVTTSYSVKVTDLFTGCEKTLNTTIQLINFCSEDLVGVPNAFTPNGDGENDVLEIKYSSALIIENYKFQVFDRWGGLLFQSNDINERWDGTSRGRKVPTGVVIYFLEFPCHIDGTIVQKKGDITIYRQN
ncbi:MAG: PKD domain-containing protein [Saprospiraceae bacterium]